RAPELDEDERAAVARTAAGRIDRADRLLDAASRARREALIEQARRVYRDAAFEPEEGAAALIANAQARAGEARSVEEARVAGLELTPPDAHHPVPPPAPRAQ